jgi:GNAT superfamily N-acetyltransferase
LALTFVSPELLHPLRRRVLRDDDPTSDVTDPRDTDATALHIAGSIDDRIVACSSYYIAEPPLNVELFSYQLRFMAIDFGFHRRGYGTMMLSVAEQELVRRGATQLWANARDSALHFYRAVGWSVITGSEHDGPPPAYIPHTVIFKPLGTPAP